MRRGFSFWGKLNGSTQIRGVQMAEILGGRMEPAGDYQEDTCIFIKRKPMEPVPAHAYVDIIDETLQYRWLKDHPQVGIIALSRTAQRYAQQQIGRPVHFIPEHHCNFENIRRDRSEVRTVGVIGNQRSLQCNEQVLRTRLESIGLELLVCSEYRTRQDVVDFYRQIDIQVVFRPWAPIPEIADPLKLKNAGSFGIPTVAYPEPSYVEEFSGAFIPARNIVELVDSVGLLATSPTMYDAYAALAIERSSLYHIKDIAEMYRSLP